MKQTILITGANGYLGGNLTRHFTGIPGYEVRAGARRACALMPPTAGFVQLDLLDTASLELACVGVDAVVHLAATNEIESQADPVRATELNVAGTIRLLEAARRQGVKQFLYFSTAHVYGSPLQGTIDEGTLPRPTHPYSITHRAAEDFVLAERGRLAGTVVRLSNAVGAPANVNIRRWTLIGNDLCRQAVTTGKMVLHSSGIQVRNMVAMSDVARAAQHLLDLPVDATSQRIFNLGGPDSISMIDFARLAGRVCAETLGFEPTIDRPEPSSRESSPTLDFRSTALAATGFQWHGSIADELTATLRFCYDTFGTHAPPSGPNVSALTERHA